MFLYDYPLNPKSKAHSFFSDCFKNLTFSFVVCSYKKLIRVSGLQENIVCFLKACLLTRK